MPFPTAAGVGGARVLMASSSVGLGHVARDLRLRRAMGDVDADWLTSGTALRFLELNGERVHPASRLMRSLGDVIGGSVIRGCRVRPTPTSIISLYSALRHNASILEGRVDIEGYDLVVADEFWELLVSSARPRRAAFITDFVDTSPGLWWRPLRPLAFRLGEYIRSRAREKFDLRVHVGLWGDAPGFWHPGQLATEAIKPSPERGRDGPVVVNSGGTLAGCGALRSLSQELHGAGVDHVLIGACGSLVGNPRAAALEGQGPNNARGLLQPRRGRRALEAGAHTQDRWALRARGELARLRGEERLSRLQVLPRTGRVEGAPGGHGGGARPAKGWPTRLARWRRPFCRCSEVAHE